MTTSTAPTFFIWVVQYPKRVIGLCCFIFALSCLGLSSLTRDMSADSFLSSDNPTLIYKKKVKAVFGLTDPLVIAIYHPTHIFSLEVLQLVSDLTQAVQQIDYLEDQSVTSLSTISYPAQVARAVQNRRVLEPMPKTTDEVEQVKTLLEAFPLYEGHIYSKDETMTLILIEEKDEITLKSKVPLPNKSKN